VDGYDDGYEALAEPADVSRSTSVDGPAAVNGALASLIHDDGVPVDSVGLLWYSIVSTKGAATASGDTVGRRRRRRHMKITRRTRRNTKTPRTPPTMAAMGGPFFVVPDVG